MSDKSDRKIAMRYFPVNLDLQGKLAVVIGGGTVAARKIENLLEAGAKVRVVAPELHEDLRKLQIVYRPRGYRPGDLAGAFLAVAATDDRRLNLRIRREAKMRKVLLNIIDKPEFCDFVFSSRVNRGEFMLTISTGGASPALAKKVRQDLERQFGEEYGELVRLLGKIRQKIPPPERRKYESAFTRLVRSPILTLIRRRDHRGINRLIKGCFGQERFLKEAV